MDRCHFLKRRMGAPSSRAACILAAGLSLWAACSSRHDAAADGDPSPQGPDRVLVLIVPGTHGSDRSWPSILNGQATFGSELLRALPPGSEVQPFVRRSSMSHPDRLEAARQLAALVDQQSPRFERVCLVGHSHGGNIALMAAGLCQSPIHIVVCLSTPHPHLRTADPSKPLIPVYCSSQTVAKGPRSIGYRAFPE